MSFEALNQAGHLGSDLIVILNDNEMSISPNVGALSSYLRKMVVDPRYIDRRKKAEEMLKRLPKIGDKAAKAVFDIEETLRAFTSTAGLLFKELGFKYFGPVDGHNLDELIGSLNNIRQFSGPVLLHVTTKKGYGYTYAENDRTKFHGISPFNIENGEKMMCKSNITYTEAFSNTLIKLAKDDEKIIAITAAMADGTLLNRFAEKYPDRFFDVGIAEQHAVTFAAGLAMSGFKPVCCIYSTFLQRAYDQIVHDVCLQNLPVIFALDRAGLVGEDGPTHHGSFDLSYLRHIPNLVIMAPKDENELGHMLYTAIHHNGPIAMRYPRGCGLGVKVENPFRKIKLGQAEVLRTGKDLVIFSIGSMVNETRKAADILEKKGYSVGVVNSRFVKPLDKRLILDTAKKVHNIITVEENSLSGGFGSAVLELLEKNDIPANVKRIGIPDRFIEHGSMDILKENLGLTKENIVKTGLRLLS